MTVSYLGTLIYVRKTRKSGFANKEIKVELSKIRG